MATTLMMIRSGAVGFVDWLDLMILPESNVGACIENQLSLISLHRERRLSRWTVSRNQLRRRLIVGEQERYQNH